MGPGWLFVSHHSLAFINRNEQWLKKSIVCPIDHKSVTSPRIGMTMVCVAETEMSAVCKSAYSAENVLLKETHFFFLKQDIA